MKRAWSALAIITVMPSSVHAESQASVRLDFPPGYFAAKPAPAPQKANATSRDNCASRCVNFDEGYAWAGAQKLTAEEQCHGRSRAFVEGCMVYVTERRQRQSR